MDVADSRTIAQQVLKELGKAKAEFDQFQQDLNDLVMQAPSGVPFSVGQVRFVQSGQQLKVAFEKYQNAVNQYRNLVIHGIIPDERKPNRE